MKGLQFDDSQTKLTLGTLLAVSKALWTWTCSGRSREDLGCPGCGRHGVSPSQTREQPTQQWNDGHVVDEAVRISAVLGVADMGSPPARPGNSPY